MTYPGGKNSAGVYQTIINQIPPHTCYIEAFAGSAAIFRRVRGCGRAILIDENPAVIDRLQHEFDGYSGLEPICGDAVEWLEAFNWQGTEFVYADPPYLRETLRDKTSQMYLSAFGKTIKQSRAAHTRLLSVLSGLRTPVMLSGYANALYSAKLKRWRTIPFVAGTRRGRATEVIWMNYAEPPILHDYQYFGVNHRERTDFRRLVARWHRKLEAMPIVKRQALIHHLSNLFLDLNGNSAAVGSTRQIHRVELLTVKQPLAAERNASA